MVAASALLLVLIHPSAWNRNSAKFAFWAFSEVGLPIYGVLRSSCAMNFSKFGRFFGDVEHFVPHRTYTPISQAYASLVAWPS